MSLGKRARSSSATASWPQSLAVDSGVEPQWFRAVRLPEVAVPRPLKKDVNKRDST